LDDTTTTIETMEILVTGAAGFIGSRLVDLLSRYKFHIKAVDCFLSESYDPNLKRKNWQRLNLNPNVELLVLDLRDPIPDSMLKNVDIIVNLAAMPGLMKSWTDFNVYSSCNINVVENLARASINNDVKHFIQVSTSSVYGVSAIGDENSALQPVSPYGVTKMAAEELIKTYKRTFDLNFTILRYFSVYGPGQRPDMAYNKIIKAILNKQQIEIFGDGNQTRTNTYIDDCVEATYSAIMQVAQNETINISGENSYSLNQVIKLIEEIVNDKAEVVYKKPRPGDQKETKGNIAKAKLLLNYSPKIDLIEGLRKQIEWQIGNS
jgi:UDP-glucuronate 4-epimerase